MSNYWAERMAKAQSKLTDKNIADTEKQLARYYRTSQQKIIGQFEKVYQKVFSQIAEGKEVTPADLYKLDSYWKMQGQLQQELQKLGDKQAELLGNKFTQQYQSIYDGIALPSGDAFSSVNKDMAQQMINQIWCADGKSWSQRVWDNTDKLQQALNDNLIDCVLTGKKPSELKQLLQSSFGASYSRADTVVRTELAHIQTQAARDRYQNMGVTEVEILADKDERRCKTCGKLHGKRYSVGVTAPVPVHPNCRCCIIPVIGNDKRLKVDIQLFAEKLEKSLDDNSILTKRNNTPIIKLDDSQQAAQRVVDSISNKDIFDIGNQNKSHLKHAYKELDLSDDVSPKEAYQKYRAFCTSFLKEPIDGTTVDGFISVVDGQLVKYNKKTKLYGTLRADRKIGSVYTADDKYWEERKTLLHPNTDENTRQAMIEKLRKNRNKRRKNND